jgi:hypothetical protein
MSCSFGQWIGFPAEITSIGSRDGTDRDAIDIFDSHIATTGRGGFFPGHVHPTRERSYIPWPNNLTKYPISGAGSRGRDIGGSL